MPEGVEALPPPTTPNEDVCERKPPIAVSGALCGLGVEYDFPPAPAPPRLASSAAFQAGSSGDELGAGADDAGEGECLMGDGLRACVMEGEGSAADLCFTGEADLCAGEAEPKYPPPLLVPANLAAGERGDIAAADGVTEEAGLPPIPTTGEVEAELGIPRSDQDIFLAAAEKLPLSLAGLVPNAAALLLPPNDPVGGERTGLGLR